MSSDYSSDPLYVAYLFVFLMQVVSIPEKGSRKNSRNDSIQVTYSIWSLMNTCTVYHMGQIWIQLNEKSSLKCSFLWHKDSVLQYIVSRGSVTSKAFFDNQTKTNTLVVLKMCKA